MSAPLELGDGRFEMKQRLTRRGDLTLYELQARGGWFLLLSTILGTLLLSGIVIVAVIRLMAFLVTGRG